MYKLIPVIILAFILTIAAASIPAPAPAVEPLSAAEPSPTAAQLEEPAPDINVGTITEPVNYYIIEREVLTEAPAPEPRYSPTSWERKLLAALAEQEDSSSEESMQAVVEVVLNRLESDHYSFTNCRNVEEVLYQSGWCNGVWVEQYQGASRFASSEPSDAAFEAVDRACQGEQLVPGALFHAEASVPPWRIANDISLVAEIGLTKFWTTK